MKNGSKILFFFISLAIFFHPKVNGQGSQLKSGPMLGYIEMREASVWIQTTEEAKVFIVYWDIGKPSELYRSNMVNTTPENAFTATLIAGFLQPNTTYRYSLYINGQNIATSSPFEFTTPEIWRWRKDPPAFSFLFGSGTYINDTAWDRPGEPYGSDYEIFESMADKNADFMIWLGDNVYYRQQEWNTWSGVVHRYSHDRATPELQRFLATTHHYAILDDHDFGPNNSDRSFWNKKTTLKAFDLFWANPSVGTGNISAAVTSFQWGDADFFLLDNRTFRSPDDRKAEDKTQLGEEQLQWLFDNLASSKATFKFVALGGQFLSTSREHESYSNYGFDGERQRIIDYIRDQEIRNVIFLTGDVHFSEVSELKEADEPTLLDFTSSALTSGVNTNAINQENSLRVPGSVIMEHNFARISITGPADARIVKLTYFNKADDVLKEYSFNAEYSE